MARFEVDHVYDLRLPRPSDETFGAWTGLLHKWERTWIYDDGPEVRWSWRQTPPGRLALCLTVTAEARDRWQGRSMLETLDQRLGTARERARLYGSAGPAERVLEGAIQAATAQVTVRMPLRTEDAGVITTDQEAAAAVASAVREHEQLLPDAAGIVADLDVRLDGDRLVLSSGPAVSVDAAVAYLSVRSAAIAAGAASLRKPVWAIASTAIAVLSVGLSFLPLATWSLIVLGTVASAVAVAAVIAAPRWHARPWTTFWGMSPVLALVLFACVYGAVARSADHAIQVAHATPEHLREPLILSLSLLTTGGDLDLQLEGWVRSIAYLEMLLLAGLAGGAAVVAVRRASVRFEEIVGTLRRDSG